VLEKVRALPGVRSATYSSVALLSRVRQNKRITIPGVAMPANLNSIVNTNGVAPNFFVALELPLVLGRGFTPADDVTAPRVAVVNQVFVRSYMGDQNPIGHALIIGPGPEDRVDIVGVAADAKYTDLRGATPATIYLPARQRLDGDGNFALRAAAASDRGGTAAASAALFGAIRSAIREIDPALPVLNLRTQAEQIDRLHAQERLFARLSGVFGVLALTLAGIGLYGLMSHSVARRTSEIGLCMALGAVPGQVLWMVLRESLTLAGAGLLLGVAAAAAAGRLVAAMLFGLSTLDVTVYAAVAGLLTAVALLSALLPARRASRIDPMSALRLE
jgi:predicted permease